MVILARNVRKIWCVRNTSCEIQQYIDYTHDLVLNGLMFKLVLNRIFIWFQYFMIWNFLMSLAIKHLFWSRATTHSTSLMHEINLLSIFLYVSNSILHFIKSCYNLFRNSFGWSRYPQICRPFEQGSKLTAKRTSKSLWAFQRKTPKIHDCCFSSLCSSINTLYEVSELHCDFQSFESHFYRSKP